VAVSVVVDVRTFSGGERLRPREQSGGSVTALGRRAKTRGSGTLPSPPTLERYLRCASV
jgi:hypothetical protein